MCDTLIAKSHCRLQESSSYSALFDLCSTFSRFVSCIWYVPTLVPSNDCTYMQSDKSMLHDNWIV